MGGFSGFQQAKNVHTSFFILLVLVLGFSSIFEDENEEEPKTPFFTQALNAARGISYAAA